MFWNFRKSTKKSSGERIADLWERAVTLKTPIRALISELGGEVLSVHALSKENIYLISPKLVEEGRVLNLFLDLSFGGEEEPLHLRALVLRTRTIGGPFDRRYEIVLRPILKSGKQRVAYNRKLIFLLSLIGERS